MTRVPLVPPADVIMVAADLGLRPDGRVERVLACNPWVADFDRLIRCPQSAYCLMACRCLNGESIA